MWKKPFRWRWWSILALGTAIPLAALRIDFACAAEQNNAVPPDSPENKTSSPVSASPPAPQAIVSPLGPKPNPEENAIPAGPGRKVVTKSDGHGDTYTVLEETGDPLSVDQLPKVDLAAIFARPDTQGEYLKRTRASVLKIYETRNAKDSAGYEEGLIPIQLFVLSVNAGDQRGDCWFQTAAYYAALARQAGNQDILVEAILGAFRLSIRDFSDGYQSREYLNEILGLQSSDYPPIIKLAAAISALPYLTALADNQADWGMKPDDPRHYITYLLDAGVNQIEEMAKQDEPTSTLHFYAQSFLNKTTINGKRKGERVRNTSPQSFTGGKREDYQKRIADALARGKTSGEITKTLQAEYLIDLAWDARGTGTAGSVTDEQFQKFFEYLKKAEELLLETEKEYPKNPIVPVQMLKVGLGLGMSRTQMEEWFQKALLNHPGSIPAYGNKMWFLQPKWHGSGREMLDFGMECLRSGQWDDGVPLVLIDGMDLLAEEYPDFYKENTKVRNLVDSTYREYLRRFPGSIATRTRYVKFAYEVGDWTVLKDQLAILKNYWDMTRLDPTTYAEIFEEASLQ